tara:strand:- start:101 stop:400 length:300 start_codon:yes stop_codon:yes gene_type:complete
MTRQGMTPGMQKCKTEQKGRKGRIGSPFTKRSCGPLKAADAGLVRGAATVAQSRADTLGDKTPAEVLWKDVNTEVGRTGYNLYGQQVDDDDQNVSSSNS